MNEKIKVLVVDDEYAVTQNLQYALEKNGYTALTALNGEEGLELFRQQRPAVVILDIKMPGINGLKLLEILKRDAPDVAVIMLTSMGLDCDIERGLNSGADRYLVKESSPGVVVANVRAMLRYNNSAPESTDVLQHGHYRAELKGNRIEIASRILECTWHEFRLMYALIKQPHYIHKRDDLLDAVYGVEAPTDRSIDQLVKRIRRKARESGVPFNPVKTVPTIGYQLGAGEG